MPGADWMTWRRNIAAQVTAYAAAAEPEDWRGRGQPGGRPVPKVNRAWSSVHRSVEATVITAFATAHGIVIATSGTAKLERTPIPPPQTTKRTKEARGPGAAGESREGEDGDWVLSAVCGS